jgi:hypothetical protein
VPCEATTAAQFSGCQMLQLHSKHHYLGTYGILVSQENWKQKTVSMLIRGQLKAQIQLIRGLLEQLEMNIGEV